MNHEYQTVKVPFLIVEPPSTPPTVEPMAHCSTPVSFQPSIGSEGNVGSCGGKSLHSSMLSAFIEPYFETMSFVICGNESYSAPFTISISEYSLPSKK